RAVVVSEHCASSCLMPPLYSDCGRPGIAARFVIGLFLLKHISVPRPAGPDHQHGVADITYIVIATGFVYLAAILDAWSRRVVGYAIGKRIDARLALAALRAAIAVRRPPAGCIHHSDGGSQYAAEDYRASSPSTASRVRWVAAATHTTTPRPRVS